MRLNRLLIACVLGLAVAAPSFANDVVESAATNIIPNKTAPVAAKTTEKAAKSGKHEAEKTGNPVNINTASAQDIAKSLTGIGKKRAEAIVEYRTKNGPFKSVDDLTNIKGISKKVIEKNNGKILLS